MDTKDFTTIMTGLSMKLRKYSPDFTNPVIAKSWYEELCHLDPHKLWQACKKAVQHLDEFPSIKWLLNVAQGSACLSDEERGQDIASRIEESISKYGYTNASMAEKFIGKIGWEVINTMGGWSRICEVTTNEMLPSSRKQWRDTAVVVSKKLYLTGENQALALPEGSRIEKPDALRIALNAINISSMPKDSPPQSFTDVINSLKE